MTLDAAVQIARQYILSMPTYQFGNLQYPVISTKDRRIIGSGDCAIVLELPGTGYVAKIEGYTTLREDVHKLRLSGTSNIEDLEANIASLHQLGFENIINHHLVPTYQPKLPDRFNGHICIQPDLRLRGTLHEAYHVDFSLFTNGNSLRAQYNESVEMIERAVKGGNYSVDLICHDHKLRTGIGKMFFIVRDEAGSGELVICDLDHLRISKR